MASLSFDDLIPQPNPTSTGVNTGLSFDDLVPKFHDSIASGADWQVAKPEIDKLAPDQREAARNLWADALVAKERQGGGTLQNVDDAVRRTATSVPLAGSWLDEAGGVLGQLSGQDYNMRVAYERAKDRAINNAETTKLVSTPLGDVTTGGLQKTVGTVAGALAIPVARVVEGVGAIPGAINVGLNAGVSGAVDAAGSATDGHRLDAAMDAGVKSGLSGLTLGGLVGKITGKAATPSLPSKVDARSIKQSAGDAYAKADSAGVIFTPDAVQRIRSNVQEDLTQAGYHPDLQPRINTVLSEFDRLSTQNVTLKGVDQLRRIARAAGQSNDPSERMLASKVIDRIDEMVQSPQAGDVLTGNSDVAAKAVSEARDLWSRARKTEMIDDALVRADRRAASTGSGGNINNTTRQNIRAILDNPKKARLFNEQEKALMEDVVRGTTSQNVLRLVGKMSPEGNGLMQALNIGAIAYNPPMAAATVAGFIAKRLADAGSLKNAERLRSIVSNGTTVNEFAKWQKVVNAFRVGDITEPTLRVATQTLAKHIADASGEDRSQVFDALIGGQK